jgi:multicomponent Na+:H+ antiporter subunit D
MTSPAVIPIAAAALLAGAPARVRPSVAVLGPALALAYVATALPLGTYVTAPLLGYTLELVRVDELSRIFGLIFALVGAITAIYAWTANDRREQVAAQLYLAGALGVTFAGDLLTFYCFWELMAVTAAALVWVRGTNEATRAGMRYALVHLTGGGVLLVGILIHVAGTGSITFARFDPSPATWLILLGLCVSAAVPPLGAWLPDAYPKATVTGAVLMSALTTKSAVYALLRGFPGWEILVPFGVMMALWGVVYAVLANDIRELLAYHIISQVGYMVAGCGLGTAMSVNGAAAHAVCHILYKSLLFMGAGVVIRTTGKRKLTDLGGFWRRQPVVFGLYMIGAFSISGFPLWNGFVSKAMVIAAAGEEHRNVVYLLLTLASVGTFLHTGLKLPYFTWMGEDSGIEPEPTPRSMIVAMAIGATLCTVTGIWPAGLYALLPYPVHWAPYTTGHVVETVQLLLFTFFVFYLFIPKLGGEPTVSMDTDVVYRKGAPIARRVLVDGVAAAFGAADRWTLAAAATVRRVAADPFGPLTGRRGPGGRFDPDVARPPLVGPLTWTLLVLGILAAVSMACMR